MVAICSTPTVRRIQRCVYRRDSKDGYSGYSDAFTEGKRKALNEVKEFKLMLE